MHPDQRLLLDTILAYPDDDTPRLVYADWLEENGASERAEMIRRQVRYASLRCEMWEGVSCDDSNQKLGQYRLQTWCPACIEINEIRTTHIDCAIETGGVPLSVQRQDRSTREPILREITNLPALGIGPGDPVIGKQCTPVYRRGFVDEVSCTMGCWEKFAEEIMRWHPVRRVNVTDKSPWNALGFDVWRWLLMRPNRSDNPTGDMIPYAVYECIIGREKRESISYLEFATQKDALDALSDACIQFGKGK